MPWIVKAARAVSLIPIAALPCVLQAGLALAVITANTGNGSWAGLGAMLAAMVVIPVTFVVSLLVNGYSRPGNPAAPVLRSLAVGVAVPVGMAISFVGPIVIRHIF